MAEYEPFPTGRDEIVTDHTLKRRILGCFGCGGLGVAGFFGVLALLVGSLGTGASGCDLDLGDPGDGTDSQRLAVDVSPRTDLEDGSVVRVTSDAFGPDAIVGIAVCLRSADTERRGVAACDEIQGARYATDAEGRLDATFPVPRVITVGGQAYDCAQAAERCLVVAADANDYDRSGGQPVRFGRDLEPADLEAVTTRPQTDLLPIGSEPAAGETALADGTELTILASGFQPGEPLLLAHCTDEFAEAGAFEACDPVDDLLAVEAVMTRSVEGDFPRADESGAFTTTLPVRRRIAPFAGDLGRALTAASETSTTSTTGAVDPGPTTSSPSTTAVPDPGDAWCTRNGGGCVIVVAAAADTKRSAVLPYVAA